ncbi:zinc finger protein 532-like [Anticarsia gemmatalis]|uniref:zinc finger protein 532-like n=1 Tax=Anticarsia gemmatalis TaxID=129554 RepID=UPI003F773DAA
MDMMESSEKHSIKSLIFTKALPNYVIPIPTNGHKLYACTDCGDKFIFESSLNDHISRKSAIISYMCRHCNTLRVFYNRCNLLFHIRSHSFKSATINVSDLKIEPLPMSNVLTKSILPVATTSNSNLTTSVSSKSSKPASNITIGCFECKANICVTGTPYKDRVSHFMKPTNELFGCPICLFALPTICGLKMHLRLHLKRYPYYCPECGIPLTQKNVVYPYHHDCQGFKRMRATARLDCSVPQCVIFHPNEYKEHMKKHHLKQVYKCPFCVVACFSEPTMTKHLKGHNTRAKPLIFFQCDICPGKYVMQNPKVSDEHLKSHKNKYIYPCWACGSTFRDILNLLKHFIKKHNTSTAVRDALNYFIDDTNVPQRNKPNRIYRVVKRCDQCNRSFTYKCKFEEIQMLPNECPFKCTSTMESNITPESGKGGASDDKIVCYLCKARISEDWSEIKKHFGQVHKAHKCVDPEILITKMDFQKYFAHKKNTSNKSNGAICKRNKNKQLTSVRVSSTSPVASTSKEQSELYECSMCGTQYGHRETFENHIKTHKDPCMAYQCMECGQSFVVKPSFSKHLLLEHGISDAEHYITNKKCYNEDALKKYQQDSVISDEPLGENQCNICRDQFDGPEDLEKHYRVHGMAFLLKNTSKNNNSL